MTVVEYETWVLWVYSESSNSYGKCWTDWFELPDKLRHELVEEHIHDLQR